MLQSNHLAQIDALAKRGVGIACLHYAVEVPKEKGGPEFLSWLGGYFEPHWSVNPHWTLAKTELAESHPIALRQCPAALAALGLTPVEAFDTAGAARAVAEAGDVTRAAVAPAGAAEVYDLSILRNDIQDSESNRTRFVLLSIRTA